MRERKKDDLIVEVCPQCRGVWLDAGELEKLTVRERGYYGDRDDDDDGNDQGNNGVCASRVERLV